MLMFDRLFLTLQLLKLELTDEEGATAVEYGIMVALIAIAIIATVTLVGTNLEAVFARVRDALVF